VALGTLRSMIWTKNRFARQVAIYRGLHPGFRALGDSLAQSTPRTTH
jgi:hypothetical protein